MTDGTFPDRLTQLRTKWENDPTSRIFLQLAEEYRHLGRVKEALAVLEKGLKEHPGYLSALVAKGRCHLELAEGEPARAVLERVVKQDATQMVANKLLVRAYLETGDLGRARERLDLYTLLNDSDPEIEELRRRIKNLDRPAPAPAEEPRRMDADPFSLEPPVARRHLEPDVFDIELVPPPPPGGAAAAEVFSLPEPAAVAVAEPPAEEVREEADVVFPGLASRDRRERYLAGLAAEGLFAFGVAAAPPEPAAPPPLAVELPEEPSWLEELPGMEAASAAAPLAEEEEAWPLPEPVPAGPAEPVEALWEEEETLEELPPPPAAAAGREPVATATLGELYLRQGHLAEAERLFREVLQREPGSAAARAGLDRLGALEAPPPAAPAAPAAAPLPPVPLAAAELMAGYRAAPELTAAAGLKARKVHLLNEYLKRLRRGAELDVS